MLARTSQLLRRMAAVLCLVFLPLIAAVGFMFGVVGGEHSLASVVGGLTFVALGAFMLGGVFKMAGAWDAESEKSH